MAEIDVETLILSGVLHSEDYSRKVLPHLKREFFQSEEKSVLFDIINNYRAEYTALPTEEALDIEIENQPLSEDKYRSVHKLIKQIASVDAGKAVNKLSTEWMIDKTEEHCKQRAIYNAMMESLSLIDKKDPKERNQIPDILHEALGVSFDINVGHAYMENADQRWEEYNRKETKIPFHLDMLNKITNGGAEYKTLNLFVAPTNVGKTMFLCDSASYYLMEGYNVLYLSLEESEYKIGARIDANLLDVSINKLDMFLKDDFLNKVSKLRNQTTGEIVIKQFPPGEITSADIGFLLDELALKKQFCPQIVIVDYLNNLGCSKKINVSDMYKHIKTVAEELRGVMIKRNLMGLSATQTNRGGQNNSDYDLNEVSESHGLSMTADWMIGGISTEEFEEENKMKFKQLKNRYGDVAKPRSFMVGIDRNKMRFIDVDNFTAAPQNDDDEEEGDEVDGINTSVLNNGKFKL